MIQIKHRSSYFVIDVPSETKVGARLYVTDRDFTLTLDLGLPDHLPNIDDVLKELEEVERGIGKIKAWLRSEKPVLEELQKVLRKVG